MVELIAGAVISFVIFTIVTHPRSKLNRKFPEKKIKNIQIFPRLTLSMKDRVFHLHHWILLTNGYIFLSNISKGMSSNDLIQGLFIGGIAQGLLFKDRFKLVFRHDEHHLVKNSSFHIPLWSRLKSRL